MVDLVVVQVITAVHPEWIYPFTGLQPAQFRRLVRLVAERGGDAIAAIAALLGVVSPDRRRQPEDADSDAAFPETRRPGHPLRDAHRARDGFLRADCCFGS